MTHPNRAFTWADEAEMRAFVAVRAFAHIFVVRDGAPFAAHAPVVPSEGGLRFHLARSSRVRAIVDGTPAIASIAGVDAYVSPDWYGTPDQVPTWNYIAVEVEGTLRRLDEGELVQQLDALSALHEARLAPKPAWTRDKMAPGRFDAMLPGLTGYELVAEEWRGTRKLGQHKRADERAGAAAGVAAAGHPLIAQAMAAS